MNSSWELELDKIFNTLLKFIIPFDTGQVKITWIKQPHNVKIANFIRSG